MKLGKSALRARMSGFGGALIPARRRSRMTQRALAVIITFADRERGLRIARLGRHREQPQRSLRRRLG